MIKNYYNFCIDLFSKQINKIKVLFVIDKSKGNAFFNEGIIKQIRFDISGFNNTIILEKGVSLSNIKFYIRGDNHKIIIKENTVIKGGTFWIEDKHCELNIGNNNIIEEAHIAITEP